MNRKRLMTLLRLVALSSILFIFTIFCWAQNEATKSDKSRFQFNSVAIINVTNAEELYAAVNDPANAGNQIVLSAGVYTLSATASGGAARPNGGRLELQENMSLRGVAGDRGAVVIDASGLPASSYTTPITNTGAIRLGKGTNSVEWLTVKNAVGGGAGIIVHRSTPGTAFVRVAHCVSTGNSRGIDIRNVAAATTGFIIEAEIVDSDLYNNRISTAQGLRIINQQGVSGNVINAYLSGNRIFDNQQGLIVENLGSTNGGVISVYSSGDRFYENGGGATIGSAFGPSNNNTVNFTAVGSAFENNNGPTDFFRGGLNFAGSISFQTANGGSNNIANATLRNCRFANNQVADLAVFGAASLPVSIGSAGTNNLARVSLFGTVTPKLISADSNPASTNANTARVVRGSGVPSVDFDGDGRADISVWRPSNGTWYLNRSSAGFTAMSWGVETDRPVPADYDGDGKTDIAVWRPGSGTWFVVRSATNTFTSQSWGQDGDLPAPGDFDGDGGADMTIFRPSTGFWYRINSSNLNLVSVPYGQNGDRPVVSDYDGDGRADLAVYRPSDHNWYVQRTSSGYVVFTLGSDDSPIVPADYDGDGRTEIAIISPTTGIWYSNSLDNGVLSIMTGPAFQAGDVPVPADYDGDGRANLAVFVPASSIWTIGNPGGNSQISFGQNGDRPIASVFTN